MAIRDIGSHDSKSYPYTYPLTYATEEGSRQMSNPTVRSLGSHDSESYPYTYPITYAIEEGSRKLSNLGE